MSRGITSLILFTIVLCCGCQSDIATIRKNSTAINRLPVIEPDYIGSTIPPNIAPINFKVIDSSVQCVAEIKSIKGSSLIIRGEKGGFRIPPAGWRQLLKANTGKPLLITIYSRNRKGTWQRYRTIEDTIAVEPIDRYCTYRLLNFQYNYSSELRECERDLSSFDERVLVNSRNFPWGCVNCHTPNNNDSKQFILQVRSSGYGSETLIADGDSVVTLNSRLGYASWHPGGNRIAFSVYKVEQYFHAVRAQFIDVCDRNSDIVIYDVSKRKILPVQQLQQKAYLETWPCWSADGRYLYFCSAVVSDDYFTSDPPAQFETLRYSLLRISYNADEDTWGTVDTILSARETGLSIAQPKVSPDNRLIVFCMQQYGAYPHTQVSSDLYCMDMKTREYRKLPVNSAYNESWHSWSQNSRWLLFSSKRGGGIFTRLYFTYIDAAGKAHKPFILPQHDPAFYDSFIKCYNVGELAVAPVRFSERQLLAAITTKKQISVPVTLGSEQGRKKSNGVWEGLSGGH